MALCVTAKYKVRTEGIEKCKTAIQEFVQHTDVNEPMVLVYIAMQEEKDNASFFHYMVFEDAEARERHMSSGAMQHFQGVLYSELLSSVELDEYHIIASKLKGWHVGKAES